MFFFSPVDNVFFFCFVFFSPVDNVFFFFTCWQCVFFVLFFSPVDNVFFSPVDNVVEVVAPYLEAVVVAGRDVADDVHFVPLQLRRLQFVHQPLQLVRRVLRVQQQPPKILIN